MNHPNQDLILELILNLIGYLIRMDLIQSSALQAVPLTVSAIFDFPFRIWGHDLHSVQSIDSKNHRQNVEDQS